MATHTGDAFFLFCGLAISLMVFVQGIYTVWTGQARSVWARLLSGRRSTASPRLLSRVVGGMLLLASLGFLMVIAGKLTRLVH
jgi:hypothetical protein